MFNDPRKRGYIVVRPVSYPTPEDIRQFIKEQMSNYHMLGFDPSDSRVSKKTSQLTSAELYLFCPRFVLKLISKAGNDSDIRLLYNLDTLMLEVSQFWGQYDIIIQPFIRQKHISKP